MDDIFGINTIEEIRARATDDSTEVLAATLESLAAFPGITDAINLGAAERLVRLAYETKFRSFQLSRIIRNNWEQDGPRHWTWIEATPEFALHLARRGMDEYGNDASAAEAVELERKWSARYAQDEMLQARQHLLAAADLLTAAQSRQMKAIILELDSITRAVEL